MVTFLILLFALFLLFVFLWMSYVSQNAQRQAECDERVQRFDHAHQKLLSVLDGKSSDRTMAAIDELKDSYKSASPYLSKNDHDIYRMDMEDLESILEDQEEERWSKKAEKHLRAFADYYYLITSGDMHDFRNVEELLRIKSKCISEWQSYFAIDVSEYKAIIYPKRRMREFMGSDYNSCMDSHDALEKHLSACVDSMRPEYRRKMKLFSMIVDYVESQSSIARPALLSHDFDGFIQEEVKVCYRALVKKNRLVEVKLGNRFFVSLSDSEIDRRAVKGKRAMA